MVADLWISTSFGLEISETDYQYLAKWIVKNPKPRTKEHKELKKALMQYHECLTNTEAKRPFNWELEFPEVFFNESCENIENPGFDAVIGNPPYGASLDKDEKIYLTKKFVYQSYQLDSYLLFIEQSINYLLAKNGFFGMIVPNPWLTNLLQNNMRRLVITKTLVCEIVHFLFSVFPKVTVNNQIVILQKGNFANWKPLVKVVDSINTLNKLQNRKNIQEITHSQDYWIKLNGQTINIFLSMSETKLAEKLRKKGVELSKLCNINVGIKPYQVGKGKPLQTKETMEKRIFDSNTQIDRSYRQYLRGKDIHRYIIAPIKPRFLKYGPWLAEPRPSANFNAPVKIIMRQTGDSLIAALDTNQYLCLNNMHVIVPQIEFPSMKYILGIINSKLINWYYQVLNPERGEALAEVKKSNVAKLPIFVVDTKNKPEKFMYDKLVEMVDQMLYLNKKLSNAEMANEREALEFEIDATDKQIDRLVYELYGLTDEEIEIVEGAD